MSKVNVFINQSTTSLVKFSAAKSVTLAAQKEYFPVVGKFDGDSKPDLALVGNDHVYLFTGDGAGNFAAAASVPTGAGCDSAAAADLNGDGLDDLVVNTTATRI